MSCVGKFIKFLLQTRMWQDFTRSYFENNLKLIKINYVMHILLIIRLSDCKLFSSIISVKELFYLII